MEWYPLVQSTISLKYIREYKCTISIFKPKVSDVVSACELYVCAKEGIEQMLHNNKMAFKCELVS